MVWNPWDGPFFVRKIPGGEVLYYDDCSGNNDFNIHIA
jgi:hypothetical protein